MGARLEQQRQVCLYFKVEVVRHGFQPCMVHSYEKWVPTHPAIHYERPALVAPLHIVGGRLRVMPRDEVLLTMVAVSNDTTLRPVNEHVFTQILIVHPSPLFNKIFMFHINVIVHRVEIFVIFTHIINIYEITLRTRYPFNLLQSSFSFIWES